MEPKRTIMLSTILLLTMLATNGHTLQCFACNSALTPTCLYGNKNVNTMKCLEDYICISYHLEHILKEGTFPQVVRGCQDKSITDPCKLLLTEQKIPGGISRGKYCYTCDTDLCNNSNGIRTNRLLILLIIGVFVEFY